MRWHVTARSLAGAALTALALVSASSCGGADGSEGTGAGGSAGTGGGSAGTGGGSGQSDRGDKYASAFCTRTFKCCKTEEIAQATNEIGGRRGLGYYDILVDYAACRLMYRGYWEGSVEYLIEAGTAAARLGFDETAFDQCLVTYTNQPCGASASLEDCAQAFVPKVDEGGGCQDDKECKTGKCGGQLGDTEGTCLQPAPRAPLGGKCDGSVACDTDLACVEGTCSTPLPDGTPCHSDDECASEACMLNTTGQCATICVGGGPGPGAPNQALEALVGRFADAYCEQWFACCDPSERWLLAWMGGGLDSQVSCHNVAGADWAMLLARLHLSSASGRLAVDANALAACVDLMGNSTCADFGAGSGLPCADAIKGLVANGQECDWDLECVSLNCVKPEEEGTNPGTCTDLPGAGAACNEDCVAGYYCEASVCVPTKAQDSPCTKDEQCAQRKCVKVGDAGASTCALACDGK